MVVKVIDGDAADRGGGEVVCHPGGDLLGGGAAAVAAYAAAGADEVAAGAGPAQHGLDTGLMNCLLDIALDADKVTGPVLWQHGEVDQLVPPSGCASPRPTLRPPR